MRLQDIEIKRKILIGMIEGMSPSMLMKLMDFITVNEKEFNHLTQSETETKKNIQNIDDDESDAIA